MRWQDPIYPPTSEKILYDKHGIKDGKRLEARDSMTAEQYAFIQIICAIKANPARAFAKSDEIVIEAKLLLDEMVTHTKD